MYPRNLRFLSPWSVGETAASFLRRMAALALPVILLGGCATAPDLEVITTTEMTEEGRELGNPSVANPVYYVAVNIGYRDMGGIIAGDKLPTAKEMNDVLVKVLARQGYRMASEKHPPTQVILWCWGTLYVETLPTPNPGIRPQINRNQMLRFLGADQVGIDTRDAFPELGYLAGVTGLTMGSADRAALLDAAKEDLYVIALGCYTMESLVEKKPRCLWKTKISSFARGLVMAESLPKVAVLAGPNIGRDTGKPVFVTASDKFKGEVLLGTPVVLPDEEPPSRTDSAKPSK